MSYLFTPLLNLGVKGEYLLEKGKWSNERNKNATRKREKIGRYDLRISYARERHQELYHHAQDIFQII